MLFFYRCVIVFKKSLLKCHCSHPFPKYRGTSQDEQTVAECYNFKKFIPRRPIKSQTYHKVVTADLMVGGPRFSLVDGTANGDGVVPAQRAAPTTAPSPPATVACGQRQRRRGLVQWRAVLAKFLDSTGGGRLSRDDACVQVEQVNLEEDSSRHSPGSDR